MITRTNRLSAKLCVIAAAVAVAFIQFAPPATAESFTNVSDDWTDAIRQTSMCESRNPSGESSSPMITVASHNSSRSCGNRSFTSSGTLFQWVTGNNVTGGPDLGEPLVTDRPDFTESSSVVGLGVTQLEIGYTFVRNDDGGEEVDSHSFGEPLLRTGILANWFELRLAVFPLMQETKTGVTSDTNSGTSDLYVGAKIGLTPQDGILPEMAVIPQMFAPTGSSRFTSGRWEPGVNWIYAWDLNDCISTAGSTQINRRFDDNGESFTAIAQSWTVACSLTDKLGAYTEWFVLASSAATDVGRPQHYFNGGFVYLINNDLQWDIRAGNGLNSKADDFFCGIGLSIRFQ